MIGQHVCANNDSLIEVRTLKRLLDREANSAAAIHFLPELGRPFVVVVKFTKVSGAVRGMYTRN